ncbi:MAG: hypothetical protein HS111_30615 [Kofleriaceae bacterium]|nr:hypothetical protein [Kofleriaceae bacterium]
MIVPDVARTPARGARRDRRAGARHRLRAAASPDAPPPWRDPRALLALFASPRVLAWRRARGRVLHGDYRRFKTAFLAPMPLPDRVP